MRRIREIRDMGRMGENNLFLLIRFHEKPDKNH
jgi:hypothetical protein